MYDMIVIGGGPAGVAAAIYGKSRGKNVLVLEKNKVGGLIGSVSTVTHYPGIVEEETGATFAARLKKQAESSGIPFQYEEVTQVDLEKSPKTIQTNKNTYEAKTVVIANGGSGRMLGIPGETLKGMRLNAPRDGEAYKGKNVYVIGGADGAVKEALYLSKFAKEVTLVCVEDELACIPEFKEKALHTPNLKIMPHSSLVEVLGDGKVEELVFQDNQTNEKTHVKDDQAGVFVYAGIVPNTNVFPQLDKDEAGYIVTDEQMETSIPNVFAAGDIRSKKIRQVATAAADGAIAGIQAASRI